MLRSGLLPAALFLLLNVLPVSSPPCLAENSPTADILRDLELEDLVEPIALYPDVILKAVLPASTFPDQIVDAALLIKSAADAPLIRKQQWDESVKVIATYPGVLKMMYGDLKWTAELGQAYLEEHRKLLDALQRARTRAYNLGRLKSNQYQTVSTETSQSGNTLIIVQPASTETVYVPETTAAVEKTNTESALVPLASFGLGMAAGASLDDDHDDYYYGGGPVYWDDDDRFDQWVDHREDMWEDYNDRRSDQQEFRREASEDRREFRQDMIEQGNWQEGGASPRADQIKQKRSENHQRRDSNKPERQPANQRSASYDSNVSRSWGDSSAWGRPAKVQTRPASYGGGYGGSRQSGGSAFQGYQSGARASAMSARGSASRGGFGGAGGGRGGGGRR